MRLFATGGVARTSADVATFGLGTAILGGNIAGVVPGPRAAQEPSRIPAWWAAPAPIALRGDLEGEDLLDSGASIPT